MGDNGELWVVFPLNFYLIHHFFVIEKKKEKVLLLGFVLFPVTEEGCSNLFIDTFN